MFPISLVTIAKNEEDVIEFLLKSVKPIVSEIILVDTGSSDQTVEVAKKYDSEIFHYEWHDDFGDAKNFGIKKASQDWILVLDADERIETFDGTELSNMLLEDVVWSLKSIHEFNRGKETLEQLVYQPRLFRNKDSFRYHGRIHEELRFNNTPIQTKRTVNMVFRHTGYLKERIQRKDKINRNVKIHILEFEKEPDNPRQLFRAAQTCFHAQDYIQAKALYERIIELDIPTKQMFASVIVNYSYVCQYLSEYERGYSLLISNIELIDKCVDAWYALGLLFLAKKQLELLPQALKCFEKCLTLGETEPEFEHTFGTGSFLAAYNIGLIYETLRDPKADRYYKIAAKYGYQNARERILMRDKRIILK